MSQSLAAVVSDVSQQGAMNLVQGKIGRISEAGEVFVQHAADASLTKAKVLMGAASVELLRVGSEVLLAVPKDNSAPPIVLGGMVEFDDKPTVEICAPDPAAKNDDLVIEANKSVKIRCGKSEIILRRTGEVVIKGLTISSRAASSNKIRGASVLIN